MDYTSIVIAINNLHKQFYILKIEKLTKMQWH